VRAPSSRSAADTLRRIHETLRTDYILAGSYAAQSGGNLRLDLKIQDVRTGEVVASVTATGEESQLPDLVAQSGAKLREKLGIEEPTRSEEESTRGALPASTEVARLYSEGLDQMRLWSCDAARQALERAVQLDPSYALARAELARSLDCLGHDADARREAQRAVELAEKLPEHFKLDTQLRAYFILNDWNKELEYNQRLFRMFPESSQYGLGLAVAQLRLGKREEAMATFELVRHLPGLQNYLDVDFQEIFGTLGDPADQVLAKARQLVEKARAQGVISIEAEAHFLEARSLIRLGRLDDALAALDQCDVLTEKEHDHDGTLEGAIVRSQVYASMGDLEAAQAALDQAKRVSEELKTVRRNGEIYGDEGLILEARGDLAGARAQAEQAVTFMSERQDPGVMPTMHLRVASLLLEQGDLVATSSTVRTAREAQTRFGGTGALPFIELVQAGLSLASGDLAGARAAVDAAERLGQKLEGTQFRPHRLLVSARIYLRAGRPADAEKEARAALAAYHEHGVKPDEAEAAAVLGAALLAQGRVADAKATVEGMRAKARFGAAISLDTVLLAADGKVDALGDLAARAAAAGFVTRAFDARLALAEATIRSGNHAGALALLDALSRDALARGFRGVSDRVAALITDHRL
jgi:tetratricopeptide (TPR) repeat protein